MKQTAQTFNEDNIKYLEKILGEDKVKVFFRVSRRMSEGRKNYKREKRDYETVINCLKQMEEAGDNHWWLSDDKKVVGYYQLINNILLIPFGEFHEALEFLLGRPVWTHELGLNREGLIEEAKRAFDGHQDSEEQKAESIAKSFDELANSGIPVIGIVVD